MRDVEPNSGRGSSAAPATTAQHPASHAPQRRTYRSIAQQLLSQQLKRRDGLLLLVRRHPHLHDTRKTSMVVAVSASCM
jgi:hypothetical protein